MGQIAALPYLTGACLTLPSAPAHVWYCVHMNEGSYINSHQVAVCGQVFMVSSFWFQCVLGNGMRSLEDGDRIFYIKRKIQLIFQKGLKNQGNPSVFQEAERELVTMEFSHEHSLLPGLLVRSQVTHMSVTAHLVFFLLSKSFITFSYGSTVCC